MDQGDFLKETSPRVGSRREPRNFNEFSGYSAASTVEVSAWHCYAVAHSKRQGDSGHLTQSKALAQDLNWGSDVCMIHQWPGIDRSLLNAALANAESAERRSAIGDLLERCRGYLLLVAAAQLSERIRSKVAPSDIVQQTFMEARRDLARFDGQSPEAFVGWLRRVLENNIADAHRKWERAQQRRVDREEALPANSSWNGHDQFVDAHPTPQSGALSREEQARLDAAIAKLPAETQLVIHLRYVEELQFDEIGRRIGKSGEAARKVWSRAIAALQQRLKDE